MRVQRHRNSTSDIGGSNECDAVTRAIHDDTGSNDYFSLKKNSFRSVFKNYYISTARTSRGLSTVLYTNEGRSYFMSSRRRLRLLQFQKTTTSTTTPQVRPQFNTVHQSEKKTAIEKSIGRQRQRQSLDANSWLTTDPIILTRKSGKTIE